MMLSVFTTLMGPLLVSIYTYNYGRWAWRQGNRRGAVGLGILAFATVALPAFVLWLHS